jgi:hypothetical protein
MRKTLHAAPQPTQRAKVRQLTAAIALIAKTAANALTVEDVKTAAPCEASRKTADAFSLQKTVKSQLTQTVKTSRRRKTGRP